MSYWTLPYQYVIPQLFKNDIYCTYKVNGLNNQYINEVKVYDGNSKSFSPIEILNGIVDTNVNSNFNLTVDLKDFVMKDQKNNNQVVSKWDDRNNDTLNAKNIYDIANTGTTEGKNISYDDLEKALKISWNVVLNSNQTNKSSQAQQFDYLSKTMLFDKKQLVNINKDFALN